MTEYRNRLSAETSPYLRQHADNPVDWFPWGESALAMSRQQDKPILLSIGYSACHWCHVMAHESFEDEDTARVMNELFINIKVDREERPDLDRIYQTAHQLLMQRPGGWPLTMFLTPDQTPFFGGTYFPRESRYGLPGFRELLPRVRRFLREQPDEVASQNQTMRETLRKVLSASEPAAGSPGPAPLQTAWEQLASSFDRSRGGFGEAPKFPHASSLELLLQLWAGHPGDDAEDTRQMAAFSVLRMAEGGIYDHLGGGFCRYSVDADWMIPHFEKMLYDNGPLLALCAELWLITADPRFRRTAEQTAGWVMREMQAPDGGYFSSIDADSEGEEGRFYVWDKDEVSALLDADEYRAIAARFGLDRDANFEGRWHLHGYRDPQQVAALLEVGEDTLQNLLERARGKLFAVREQRVHPGRDDKILTSWNALMIRGMAIASRHLRQPELAESATRALDFIAGSLCSNGRLLATCKDGHAHLGAYLDDHVFLIDAILELLQCRWRRRDLDFALQLADLLLAHFEDDNEGGFYFTADDHERLITRPRTVQDDSMPSGNGVALRVLLQLGHLTGEQRYLQAADRLLHWAWPQLSRSPSACTAMLQGLRLWLNPGQTVIIRAQSQMLESWRATAAETWAPDRLTIAIPAAETGLPGLLAERRALGEACAYICSGSQCLAPVTTLEALQAELGGGHSAPA